MKSKKIFLEICFHSEPYFIIGRGVMLNVPFSIDWGNYRNGCEILCHLRSSEKEHHINGIKVIESKRRIIIVDNIEYFNILISTDPELKKADYTLEIIGSINGIFFSRENFTCTVV